MLLQTLKATWGYDGFLPGQEEAVQAAVAGEDTLLVSPTGAGKSLTYQLPALVLPGTAVVVSPLIALMQDQVSALRANGVCTGALNSHTDDVERQKLRQDFKTGRLKLLYLSPERLVQEDMRSWLSRSPLSFVAIDEAHCISQWGHDFRPEYRMLGKLRDWFPGLPLHACTATATESVREDIVRSLQMRAPRVLVGNFDRPNLIYRIRRRSDVRRQVEALLRPREGGIIYCIRKVEVDELCAWLKSRGHRAGAYHAGLRADERQATQEAFSTEKIDVVVATVAFGMGIDRSNVRYVIHTGMPKSIENYQQEAGRAGRDGLPAECTLLYSGQDPIIWRTIMGEADTDANRVAHAKLEEMYRFCRAILCRHRGLVQYFGQDLTAANCGHCDVCQGEVAEMEGSTTMARKILSGVYRVGQRYGVRYVAETLHGSENARIIQNNHHVLSTHGLLKQHSVDDIAHWTEQLVAHGMLAVESEYRTIRLTALGKALLKGEGTVALSRPYKAAKVAAAVPRGDELFEKLRVLRRELAVERRVPPYVIFSDATLQALCQQKPTSLEAFRRVHGVGDRKCQDFGPRFLEAIKSA
ncbi:MAG TPA: DNA helicase RecQ [Candidatus Xenobia bacterium]